MKCIKLAKKINRQGERDQYTTWGIYFFDCVALGLTNSTWKYSPDWMGKYFYAGKTLGTTFTIRILWFMFSIKDKKFYEGISEKETRPKGN